MVNSKKKLGEEGHPLQVFIVDQRVGGTSFFNTSLAAKGALAHRLQRRTACKIQNGCQGAQKWLTGSGKVSTSRLWAF